VADPVQQSPGQDPGAAGVVDEEVTGLQGRQHLGDRGLQVLVPAVVADIVVAEAELINRLPCPLLIRNPGEISGQVNSSGDVRAGLFLTDVMAMGISCQLPISRFAIIVSRCRPTRTADT
jgi:hypothetical protein